METLTCTIEQEATIAYKNMKFKYSDTSNPNYGRDGKVIELSKKRFNQINLRDTTLGEYIGSRVIAAPSWDKGFEFLTMPLRAARFLAKKYFSREQSY